MPGGRSEGMATGGDSTRHVERMRIERLRSMSPVQKFRLVSDLSAATRRLCLAGITMRHPTAAEREVMLRMALIVLGRDLAVRAYPDAARLDD